jgi:hypothetical protein
MWDAGVGNSATVGYVSWRARKDRYFAESPTHFTVQYSDDMIGWSELWSWTGSATWTTGTVRTMSPTSSLINQIPANTNMYALAPAHSVGNATYSFGYTNELNTSWMGSSRVLTYYTPAPLTATYTNFTSSVSEDYTPFVSNLNVSLYTSPWLYVSASGGVPPYTATLVEITRSLTTHPSGRTSYITSSIVYGSVAGYLNLARGFTTGTITSASPDVNETIRCVWRIVDSVGTTITSPTMTLKFVTDNMLN